MNDETYQGWTNEDTWKIALVYDNTKEYLEKALNACRLGSTYHKKFKLISLYASIGLDDKDQNIREYLGTVTIKNVNWEELISHYEGKIREGA